MSTENYQIAKSRQSTKAHLLLEIDLIGTGSTYDSSKTIYLSDNYIIVDGVKYEGIVQSWGGMDVTIYNEGISAISDYSIVLQNKRLNFMEADINFSDLFDEYYFSGSNCRVYQWFDELTNKEDAILVFKGITKQPNFNLMEINFEIVENDNSNRDIPFEIVTLNNFANAPDESIKNPLPIVFGDDWEWNDKFANKACVSPCIETDKISKTFYIADHEIKHPNLDSGAMDVLIYFNNKYGWITATNHTYTNDSDGARFILKDNVAFSMWLLPEMKGSQYSSSVTDYTNVLDNLDTTTIQLSASETFYLKLTDAPKSTYENDSTAAITLGIYVNAVSGSSPYGVLNYYNPGWTAGGTKFSTGENITGTGSLTYDIKANKDRKGIRSDNEDQYDRWTPEDLLSLEYGITVSAGCTIDISIIRLFISRMPLAQRGWKIIPPKMTPNTNYERVWSPRQKISNQNRDVSDNFSNIFVNIYDGGKIFGTWIEDQGRNNGYSEGDVITCPVYIVESILRDVLGLPDDQIHHQSFDVHGNTTDGTLKDWSFTGGIYEITNSRDVLENILKQCGSSLYRDINGKISFVVNNVIDYTRHNTTGNNLLSNFSFETSGGGGADVFSGWTEDGIDLTRQISQDGTYNSDGSYSCLFDAASNDGTVFIVYQQGLSLSASTPYRLSFDYYFPNRTAGNLVFHLYDGTSSDDFIPSTTINTINTKFKTITVDFITTANVDNVIFGIGLDNETTGSLYIDNIKFYEVKQYYEFNKDSNLSNLKIYQTPYEDLVNEVHINYWLDRGSDKFTKTAFVSSKRKFTGTYITEDLTNIELEIDVTDGSKFTAGDYIIIDREVNLVDSISSNTLTALDSYGARWSLFSSNNATHNIGAPIYFILEDSDDGNGSTRDVAREHDGTETIWRYNTNNRIEIDADWIVDTTTAVALRNYYMDYYNVPHWIIEFDCFLDSSDIQTGSIIRINNTIMDEFLKCGGTSWASKDFRIKKISRTGNMDFHIMAEEL